MRKISPLASCSIIVLALSGCSINISQPVVSTPFSGVESVSPTIPSEISSANATPSVTTTRVPVTWAHLNLTGKLIYISSMLNDNKVVTNIQMLDLTTGDITTLLSAPETWVYYATISPDAKLLIMSYSPPTPSNSSSSRTLYVMPLDASMKPQPLLIPPTPEDHYIQAEWSPDGKYIYYVHYNSNNRREGQLDPVYDILRLRYPDGQPEKIADHAFWPRISSDSNRIVYIYVNPVSGRNELHIANGDGSDPQQIALSGPWIPDIIDAPIFSPDGQTILFSLPAPAQSYQPNWFEKLIGIQVAKAHDVPSDWWSVPVTGGIPTQLTNIQTINLFASISPDEKYVASVSGMGLFVMDLNGSNLTQLIFDSGVHGTVSWIP
jgi:Tol biopolymer transport system component